MRKRWTNKKGKAKAQIKHARSRTVSRYGIKLDVELVISKIKNGDCIKLEKQSNRVNVYLVNLENEWIPFVYDRLRKTVVTALPREYLINYQEAIARIDNDKKI